MFLRLGVVVVAELAIRVGVVAEFEACLMFAVCGDTLLVLMSLL
jgi:hypothetical protein